jgi:hypothetical protein
MLLRTKPSQHLRLYSSHPSDPRHIPCYTINTTVDQFGKNFLNLYFCQPAVQGAVSLQH